MNEFPGKVTERGIETQEYFWFVHDDLNREINDKAIEDLMDDFNEGVDEEEYPFQSPIVVFFVKGMSNGIIQQGHHRFEICKKTDRKVRYTITNSYRPSSRGQENEHQDWINDELVNSYAKEGIKSYVVLQNLKEEHPSYSFAVLTTFMNGKPSSKNTLRNRLFELNEETSEKAYELSKYRIKKFEHFNKVAQRTDRPKETVKELIRALDRKDFDWEYFIERTKNNVHEANLRPEFKSISTSARARSMIQFYYNHKSRKNFFF